MAIDRSPQNKGSTGKEQSQSRPESSLHQMASPRLADLLGLLRASTNIAKSFTSLQSANYQNYIKTSSLVDGVKGNAVRGAVVEAEKATMTGGSQAEVRTVTTPENFGTSSAESVGQIVTRPAAAIQDQIVSLPISRTESVPSASTIVPPLVAEVSGNNQLPPTSRTFATLPPNIDTSSPSELSLGPSTPVSTSSSATFTPSPSEPVLDDHQPTVCHEIVTLTFSAYISLTSSSQTVTRSNPSASLKNPASRLLALAVSGTMAVL